jgi:hypothetical protein
MRQAPDWVIGRSVKGGAAVTITMSFTSGQAHDHLPAVRIADITRLMTVASYNRLFLS